MPLSVVNVPGDYFSVAGFEVTTYGRFWVTPEVENLGPLRNNVTRSIRGSKGATELIGPLKSATDAIDFRDWVFCLSIQSADTGVFQVSKFPLLLQTSWIEILQFNELIGSL